MVKRKIRAPPISSSTPASASPNKSVNKRKKTTPVSKLNQSSLNNTSTKKRRLRPGTKALREIRFFQKTDHSLIPKLSFCRVVKELLMNVVGSTQQYRIQSLALEALQEAAEHFIVRYFEESNLCAIHAKRVTLMCKDMQLLRAIKYDTELN